MLDLHRMPDKVQAVMDVAITDIVAKIVPETYSTGSQVCEVIATRGSSDILSPRLWDRFVFPYLVQIVDAAMAAGGVPYFHFDGDWNRVLPRFLELPAKVLHPDARQQDRHLQGQGDPRRPHVPQGRCLAQPALPRHA